ncbi:MAG: hypothetical protein GC157_09975 [Frankiales bacterium]|nr:hypothetical protein [Frankiales bacterium]
MTTTSQARAKPVKTLRRDQVEHAIYLDFEGNVDSAPSLLGVLVDDELVQYVVEPAMWAMQHDGPGGPIALTLEDALADVVRRYGEDRTVLAYTWHDRTVIDDFAEPTTTLRWHGRFVNAKLVADRWVNSGRAVALPTWAPDGTLASYLRLIGYRVPPAQGRNVAGPGLRRVRRGLERTHGDPTALTSGTKRHWTRVLGHNRHDLVGLRALMRHAALDTDQEVHRSWVATAASDA